MARPKKNNSEILRGILDEFWQEEAKGDLSRLKCSELETYAKKRGVNALAYDFRRDRKVRQRMDEIRAGCASGCAAGPPAYKTLDIDGLLNRCKTPAELKDCLRGFDSYWREQYERLSGMELARRQEQACKTGNGSKAGVRNLELMARVSELEAENRKLRAQNIRAVSMLKKYLYPALAESLLRGEGLLVADSGTVDMSKAVEMIEGKQPEPFPGAQEKGIERLKRQEKLMEQMRKAAKDGN